MIENFFDAIGFYTTVFFVLVGIYLLFVVSSRHREQLQRKREEVYFNLLDEIGNQYEEEEETDGVEIDSTEEEFDRATVLKAIQSLCSTDKSALAKVKKAVKESSQEGEKHKLSACTDEELKELCEEIGVDV